MDSKKAAIDGHANRAKRSLGQNFLVDPNIIRKIVEALELQSNERILEIGPGRGALTTLLIRKTSQAFLAVEKDIALAKELHGKFSDLSIFIGDALSLDWSRLNKLENLKIIGNLPYNVASPLLWDLAAGATNFLRGIFMVQDEVATRIIASPGGRTYGALSVWLQSHVRIKRLFKVSPGVFRPQPKVNSAVLLFEPKPTNERPANLPALKDLLKLMFSLRRKQIGKILGKEFVSPAIEVISKHGLDLTCRPEDLAPEVFAELANKLG